MTNSSLTVPPQNSEQITTEGDLVRPAKATNTKPRAPLYFMAKDDAHPHPTSVRHLLLPHLFTSVMKVRFSAMRQDKE